MINITCMFYKRLFHVFGPTTFSKMSIFTQKLNPITGVNDWVVQNEDYDYHQEVSRSGFADMLHDTERNQLYEKALKAAIQKIQSQGKKAKVLDIGTGTGLLSMMAARNGADTITACEAFRAMSKCAINIIKLNGFEGKIKVIPKRSTDLTVGESGDLKEKCNILVTEVFDTELIGEGAFSTFKHAHAHLLEKDCIVIPESATIYAQVVECPVAQHWNKLKDIFDDDGDILIRVPDSVTKCPGSAAVHDIQLSQLPLNDFNTMVSPIPVLRFDWSGRTPFIFERSTINSVKSESDGKAQMVFVWWDLQMDTEGKIILSCAPQWAHPLKTSKIPWRDHWMQAVYYFPSEISVKKGQEVNLISCHDEYSLWFNLTLDLKLSKVHFLNPVCDCGLHIAFARTRIGQINDTKRNKKYLAVLEKHVNKDSVVLILSDGFYFSLAASKLGAKKVYSLETNRLSRKVLSDFVKFNNLSNVVLIKDLEEVKNTNLKEVNLVFGEPYFTTSVLPWDNLWFMYLLNGLKQFLSDKVNIFPKKVVIKAVAVCFDDLHKIRSPLGNCEGFLMKDFDKLIEESMKISDDNVEAQPLWEYPAMALSDEIEIATIKLVKIPQKSLEREGTFNFKQKTDCNGIALWVDWCHDNSPKSTITTGPTAPIQIGEKIHWDMHTRQGVCLFPTKNVQSIDFYFKFDFEKGILNFHCK